MPGTTIGTHLNPPKETIWQAQITVFKSEGSYSVEPPQRMIGADLKVYEVIMKHIVDAIAELNQKSATQ
jgi:hypothetical protein